MTRLVAFGLSFVAVIVAVYAILGCGGGDAGRLVRLAKRVPESKSIGTDTKVFGARFPEAVGLKKVASLVAGDASLTARLENADAVDFPTIEFPVDPFDADDVDAIVVRMKPSTGKSQPRLQWIREGESEPAEDAGTAFRWSFDGKERTETVAVASCAGWRGRIRALRLVPTDTAAEIVILVLDGVHYARPSTGSARISVGSEVRESIITSEDANATCEAEPKSGSRLDFAVGVPDEAWNRRGGPVTFTVRVNGEERWKRDVDPRAKPEERQWIEASIEPLPTGATTFEFGVAFSKDERFPRAAFGSPVITAPGRGRHVVLVSLDTLRADHLGCYGYDKPTSPRIDALAKESVRFEQMIASAPETLESHMSIFTSLLSTAHGVYKSTHCLCPKIPTLAGTLAEHGFLTAGFVGNGFVASSFGYDHGFDRYDDGVVRANGKVDTSVTFRSALEFLEKNADRDTFTFVHTYEIHTPYAPSPETLQLFEDPGYDHRVGDVLKFFPDAANLFADFDRPARPEDVKHVIALYDAGIRATDEHVGRLIDGIAAKHLTERTMFIILSDHGEELMEHGTLANHGRSLYEEMVHVPLIVRAPDLPRGTAVKALASHLDVAPTILEWLDVPQPPSFSGKSLLDVIRGGRPPHEFVVSEDLTQFRRASIRRATTKYVRTRNVEHDRFAEILRSTPRFQKKLGPLYLHPPGEEYYDLAADPREQHDLAPELRSSCDAELPVMKRLLDASWGVRKHYDCTLHATSAGAKNLQALGYVDDSGSAMTVSEEITEEQREDIPREQR